MFIVGSIFSIFLCLCKIKQIWCKLIGIGGHELKKALCFVVNHGMLSDVY
jgi:hypothetical protein